MNADMSGEMSGRGDALPPETGVGEIGAPDTGLVRADELVILHSLACVGMAMLTGQTESASAKSFEQAVMASVQPDEAFRVLVRVEKLLSQAFARQDQATTDAAIVERLIAEA